MQSNKSDSHNKLDMFTIDLANWLWQSTNSNLNNYAVWHRWQARLEKRRLSAGWSLPAQSVKALEYGSGSPECKKLATHRILSQGATTRCKMSCIQIIIQMISAKITWEKRSRHAEMASSCRQMPSMNTAGSWYNGMSNGARARTSIGSWTSTCLYCPDAGGAHILSTCMLEVCRIFGWHSLFTQIVRYSTLRNQCN